MIHAPVGLLQLAKKHILGGKAIPSSETFKLAALSIVELCLSRGISQSGRQASGS